MRPPLVVSIVFCVCETFNNFMAGFFVSSARICSGRN
jgi:hypothetical protein